MLPGAYLMGALQDPLPILVTGPVLFVNAAVLAAVLAVWAGNLDLERGGRGLLAPVMTVSIASGAIVGALWVVLIASGLWDLAFPFPPYHGLLGLGLFIGAAASLAASVYHEALDWDGLDVAVTVMWTAVPPALIVLTLQTACSMQLCA